MTISCEPNTPNNMLSGPSLNGGHVGTLILPISGLCDVKKYDGTAPHTARVAHHQNRSQLANKRCYRHETYRYSAIVRSIYIIFMLFPSITAYTLPNATTSPPPLLDKTLVMLMVEAAKLSALVYKDATDYAIGVDNSTNRTLFSHPRYDMIRFYNNEPDQAIVARRHGRCFLAFRGTTLTIGDWLQNIGLASVDIYLDNNETTGQSCNARRGYAAFLSSESFALGKRDLEECVSTCLNPMDCLVLTGHSQGGAASTLASILLDRFHPTLITFGQPLTVSRQCNLIQSHRVYRIVNSFYQKDRNELFYDPVPFLPAAGQGRGHFGYFLMLGDDTTAVKFLGVDDNSDFRPGLQTVATPHTMAAENGNFSYEARVQALFDNGAFPVSVNGFSEGLPCDMNNPLLCASNECHAERLVCTGVPMEAPTIAPMQKTVDPMTAVPTIAPGFTNTTTIVPSTTIPTVDPTEAPTTVASTMQVPITPGTVSFAPIGFTRTATIVATLVSLQTGNILI